MSLFLLLDEEEISTGGGFPLSTVVATHQASGVSRNQSKSGSISSPSTSGSTRVQRITGVVRRSNVNGST